MDYINEKLALAYFNKYCVNYDEDVREIYLQKIVYSIVSILSQFEKLMLIALMFSLFGKTREFAIMLLVLILSRMYVGGTHKEKFVECLLHTGMIFTLGYIFGIFVEINIIIMIMVFLVELVLIFLYAPIPSKARPIYSIQRRKSIKKRGVVATLILLIISLILQRYVPYICGIIILTEIDAMYAVLKKEKM